jgi:hypothetical protein
MTQTLDVVFVLVYCSPSVFAWAIQAFDLSNRLENGVAAARVCGGGMEWKRMEEDPPRLLGRCFIRGGSVGTEGNQIIKLLSSLFWFSNLVHTDRMHYFSVADDFCWLHEAPMVVKNLFKTRFLNSLLFGPYGLYALLFSGRRLLLTSWSSNGREKFV